MGKSYLKKISLDRQYETKYCYSRSNVHVVISVVGHEESCEVWEPSREMEHPPWATDFIIISLLFISWYHFPYSWTPPWK